MRLPRQADLALNPRGTLSCPQVVGLFQELPWKRSVWSAQLVSFGSSRIHWWAIVTWWVGEFGWGKKIISWGALHYLIELLWELNELTSAEHSEQGLRQVNAIWLSVINVARNEWLQFNIVIITPPKLWVICHLQCQINTQCMYIDESIDIYAYNYIHSGSVVKNPPAMQDMHETWVQSLGWADPMEKGMATHSSILAWRMPWTGEPGRLWSMALQKSQTWLSD